MVPAPLWNRMSIATALKNELQQATVGMSQNNWNRLHEGGLTSSSGTMHGPALWSPIGICCGIPEMAGPLLVHHLCSSRMRVRSPWAHVTDGKWSGEAVENAMLRFGGGSLMVWWDVAMEGNTDFNRLCNRTLTAVSYMDETLGPRISSCPGTPLGYVLLRSTSPGCISDCPRALWCSGSDLVEILQFTIYHLIWSSHVCKLMSAILSCCKEILAK